MAYPTAAFWFLLATLPVAIWVAWSDMARMKITNRSCLVLLAVFVVVGALVLPFDVYLWRYTHFAVVLAIGFVLNSVGAVGGGDAKFAAAMAPFIAQEDWVFALILFTAVAIAAVATHRLFRAIPAVQRALPNWESWTHKKFPMGLALSGTLIAYFGLALRGLPV